MTHDARGNSQAVLSAELIERLGRLLRAERHAQSLNPVQWEALRYLARCNRFSNTPSALAAYLQATKGTVSQTLNALERKGLIARLSDPASARIVRLALTNAGRKLSAKDPLLGLADAIDSLPEYRAADLSQALLDVLAQWQRANSGKPFGACRTCRHFRKDASGGAPHWCALLDQGLSDADSLFICAEHETQAA